MTTERNKKEIVARMLLKKSVQIKRIKGKTTFVLPESLAKQLQGVYSFNLDQLRVGGDIPLHELALHMDQQASLEATVSMASEQARHLKEHENLAFETWHESKAHVIRQWWYDEYGKWPTDKQSTGKFMSRFGKTYAERKQVLIDLESAYRILNNVIKSAVIVKGDMLRSMRPLLQGDGKFIQAIDVNVVKSTRKELTSISFKPRKKEHESGKIKKQ